MGLLKMTKEAELIYDHATKKYGIRLVEREEKLDNTEYRQYIDDGHFTTMYIPIEDLIRIIEEAKYFIKNR